MFNKLMKSLLILLICSTLQSHGQIQINRFNFSVDYQNFDTDWLSGDDRTMFAIGSEFHLNEVFSAEVYFRQDQNGWVPYSHPYFGASIYGLNTNYRWGTMGRDYYIGARVYPIEQWHSTSLNLRKKYNTGFYVSLGTGRYDYKFRGSRIDIYQNPVLDTITNTTIYSTDSAHVHWTGFSVSQWGPQFGFGWKQFHTKYLYTDIAIYSNAYMRENRKVDGWFINDPDDSTPPYNQSDYDTALNSVQFWAKNGPGFLFKASIGINLDFKR